MAAIFPVCTCTLVLFLRAEKYNVFPVSALDEAGCSFLAPSLQKLADLPPSSQWQPGSQGRVMWSKTFILQVFFPTLWWPRDPGKQYCIVEFTGT